MDYRLVLSNLEIVELQFLVTVDNDVSRHVTRGISRDDPKVENVLWPINVQYPVRK